MKKKKILITGGLGNLGSWITEYFIDYFDVDVLTRNDRSVSIEKPFNKIFADLTDLDALKKALNKKMKESATNLEFEEAAKIRDEIRKLESTELEVTLNPKVKQYSLNNKIYPKGRSTMGMPGTRAQKGKKKWKQIK